MQNSLVVLLGPTGSGKTDLSIDIAREFSSEIISCDSRQFYKGMEIGTAAPVKHQLTTVKHHFVATLSPSEYYSASIFERDVIKLLPDLFKMNNIAIMCGGSGMYIDAVCDGIDEIPDVDPDIRISCLQKYRKEGIESIRADLSKLDPDHYARVDLRNHKRILRALEICLTTGKPYSSFLQSTKRERDFRIVKIGINLERDELYRRINERVDQMVLQGIENEARKLLPFRKYNALNTVGYKELFDYFDGNVTFEQAVSLIKRNSRRYAKRQVTWWTRDSSITWFKPAEKNQIVEFIEGKTC